MNDVLMSIMWPFRSNYDRFSTYTLLISKDKTVYSCGTSTNGAHGHEIETVFPFRQVKGLSNIKMVSCGFSHTICLDHDGFVFSFGCNNKGQLGINTVDSVFFHNPQKVNNIPIIKDIGCGDEFTICLSEDGNMYSFGVNSEGQLGLGNNNDYYYTPQQIPNIIAEIICVGHNYTVCKSYNNKCYIWGRYTGDIIEINTSNTPVQCDNWPEDIISIKSGIKYLWLLTLEGHLYLVGNNYQEKQIRIYNDLPTIKRIECGTSHVMCIDINNSLWVFGSNGQGQLGLGDYTFRNTPIKHPQFQTVMDIYIGGSHSYVKTIDNKIYVFGDNKCLQLGCKKYITNTVSVPTRILKGKEDIWYSNMNNSNRVKSARK